MQMKLRRGDENLEKQSAHMNVDNAHEVANKIRMLLKLPK